MACATRPAGNCEQCTRGLPINCSDTSAPTSTEPCASKYKAKCRPGRGRLAERMKDQTSPQAAGTNRDSSSGRTRLRTTAVQVGSECFSSISWRIMFVGLTISDRRWQRASAEADDVVEPVTHKLN